MTLAPSTPPVAGAAAGLGRRAGAYLIDAAIAAAIVILAVLVGSVVVGFGVRPTSSEQLAVAILLLWVVAVVVALAWWLVYSAMQGGAGSIGQRALKIRLVDAATGARIGFGWALLRNLVWQLTTSIVIGYFTPLFDSSGFHRGWHDLVGRAVMIDLRVPAVPAPVVASPVANPFVAAPFSAPAPAAPPVPPPYVQPAEVGYSTFPTVPASSTADLTHTEPHPSVGLAAGLPAVAPAPAPVPVSTPAPAGPTIPVASSGLISQVPGTPSASASPAPVPAPAPAPAAAPAYAPAAAAAALVEGDDLDATRAVATPSARARAALTWDDGTRTALHGRTIFGRNPAAEAGATVVAVRDETLSLSKTHFEIDVDADGVWIVDRHSTNGTILHRGASATTLTPGERAALQPGDSLEIGDRAVRVEAVA